MSSTEVVPGVWMISQGYVGAYLIADEQLTLIDAGLAGRIRGLREAIAEADGSRRLANIAVTHHHMDHTGGLAAILAESEAIVWAHPADAKVIRGEVPAPRPPGRNPIERAAIAAMLRLGPKARKARVEREVADGEELPIAQGLIAYHTTGHTAGHLSFLMPSKRLLFVGDAAANMMGRLGPPFGLMNEDHGAIRAGIARLAQLEFDVACFGHGRVLAGDACLAFRRLADKLGR